MFLLSSVPDFPAVSGLNVNVLLGRGSTGSEKPPATGFGSVSVEHSWRFAQWVQGREKGLRCAVSGIDAK